MTISKKFSARIFAQIPVYTDITVQAETEEEAKKRALKIATNYGATLHWQKGMGMDHIEVADLWEVEE